MLPKTYRLTKKEEFAEVFKKGKILQGPTMGLAFYHKLSASGPQIGFIVSNKISKKATQRNRIKRILREVCQGFLKKLDSSQRLVFLAKKGILQKESQEIAEEAVLLLGKLQK